MDTKRMPTHRKGAERKKIKKLGRSSGHQAKTTADSPEGSGEKRKKKKKRRARTILWTPSKTAGTILWTSTQPSSYSDNDQHAR